MIHYIIYLMLYPYNIIHCNTLCIYIIQNYTCAKFPYHEPSLPSIKLDLIQTHDLFRSRSWLLIINLNMGIYP